MKKMHRLLDRQLRRSGFPDKLDKETEEFLQTVDKTYNHLSKEIEILDNNASKMIEKISRHNANLESVIESIDGFNYHVSHDLKTSMINCMSLTKMLRKYVKKNDFEKVDNIVSKLESSSKSGLMLIEKYLKVSKFEVAAENGFRCKQNVPDLVDKLLDDLQLKDEIDVRVGFDNTNNGQVYMVEVSLQSLLQNFITNAYKYRDERRKPELVIEISSTIHEQVMTFQDNGIGMDLSENADSIFKPFVRLNRNIAEGDGIGLYVVKKIISNLQGTITTESERGVGTKFTVTIPKG